MSEGTREVTAAEMRRWLIDPPDSPEWPLRWADGSPIVTAGPEEPWTVDSLLDAIERHKARPAFTAPEPPPILMHPSLLRLIRGEPDHHRPAPPPKTDRPRGGPVWLVLALERP